MCSLGHRVLGRRHGKHGKGCFAVFWMSFGCLQVTAVLGSLGFPQPLKPPYSVFRAMGSSFDLSHLGVQLTEPVVSRGCWCGQWKELESGIIYVITNSISREPFSTKSRPVVAVINPAYGSRRDFQIEPADGSRCAQLLCLSGHVSTRAHDLVDDSTPGTLVWYNHATGQLRTWQCSWQGWHPTLVQLTGEVEDHVLRLVMRKLTGDMISMVTMPLSTSWKEARNLMVPGLRQLLSKKLVFVSPLGTVLTPLQNEQPLCELLGCD